MKGKLFAVGKKYTEIYQQRDKTHKRLSRFLRLRNQTFYIGHLTLHLLTLMTEVLTSGDRFVHS